MPTSSAEADLLTGEEWLYDEGFTASLAWSAPDINDKGQVVYPKDPTQMTAEDYAVLLPKIVRKDKPLADQTLVLPGGEYLNAGLFFDYFPPEVVTAGPDHPDWLNTCVFALTELAVIARIEAGGMHPYPLAAE